MMPVCPSDWQWRRGGQLCLRRRSLVVGHISPLMPPIGTLNPVSLFFMRSVLSRSSPALSRSSLVVPADLNRRLLVQHFRMATEALGCQALPVRRTDIEKFRNGRVSAVAGAFPPSGDAALRLSCLACSLKTTPGNVRQAADSPH